MEVIDTLDLIIIILVAVLAALFFISRSVLKKSSQKVDHYERLQHLYKVVHELEAKGLDDDEIKVQLFERFNLNEEEAEYLISKSRK